MHAGNHPRKLRFTWKFFQAFLYDSLVHQNIYKGIIISNFSWFFSDFKKCSFLHLILILVKQD